MAAIGEGDPRWIVTQREDGRNVNNWHWTEADYTLWTKNRLIQLIVGEKVETETCEVEMKSLTMNGEVSVNTRKQKTIFFYELDVTVKFEGKLKGGDKEVKGSIQIPYISEENDHDDFEVKWTVENEDNERYKAKDQIKAAFLPVLKKKVPQMLDELKETTTSKLLPKSSNTSSPSTDKSAPAPAAEKVAATKILDAELNATAKKTPTTTTTSSTSKELATCTVTVTDKFVCGREDLFMALTDPPRVKAYAGGDAEINPTVGGKFKLFGGYVSGEYLELERPSKIVQKFRFNTWPEGHYSTVTINLEQKDNKVLLKLNQTKVPTTDKNHTEGGWSSNFFSRIKGIFGYGSSL
eukprot:TRINITY_DN3453_c0_g1_i1.p1 TRINITY_DN3453_c0_g1~~TRINITY_DN3453_c0_g1_i1.p1  ORF type:complete len:352 (-),score=141.37 TRINITY_DN3453_c0_g1_i1:70-1125(-)